MSWDCLRIVECECCGRAYQHDLTTFLDGIGRVCDGCAEAEAENANEQARKAIDLMADEPGEDP